MSTKRSKRWNGELDSLAPEFLKEVIEKMQSYGDRIQFEQPNRAATPNYQVINPTGRKMGFDNRHLILRPNADGNIGDELTPVYTLQAIKAAMTGAGTASARTSRPRASGASRSTTASATRGSAPAPAAVDTVERDKYAYYKENKETLPDGIVKYSQEVSTLMRQGMSAEAAFDLIIKQHFCN